VNPTALVAGPRKDLLDRLPGSERAVADGQVRRDLEPAPLDVEEEFTPALRALAHPGLEADEIHAGLQVDPVRPHIDVASRREIALVPGVVFGLPLRRRSRDHRRRQIG